MKKCGFTLAEVILTLAIIGVTAALTIPAVITKVTQDQYVVGLKKAYNTLKAIEREAVQEYGEMKNWKWDSDLTTTFETYFKPHFDILKDCAMETDDGCFIKDYKYLSGAAYTNLVFDNTYYKIITSDGIAYAYSKDFLPMPQRQGLFYADINGKKMPNQIGRDIFIFYVFPSEIGIKPQGAYSTDGVTPISSASIASNCSTSGNGGTCAVKVLAEGAMNY